MRPRWSTVLPCGIGRGREKLEPKSRAFQGAINHSLVRIQTNTQQGKQGSIGAKRDGRLLVWHGYLTSTVDPLALPRAFRGVYIHKVGFPIPPRAGRREKDCCAASGRVLRTWKHCVIWTEWGCHGGSNVVRPCTQSIQSDFDHVPSHWA